MITSAPATPEMTAAAEALAATAPAHAHFQVFGNVATVVLSQDQTGGLLTVIEVRSPPGGGFPFLHHHPGAKTFVGLEGTYDIHGETEGEPVVLTVCTGTTVHVPSGALHAYANVSGTEGRMLTLIHGPNEVEAFVREVGTPVEDTAPPPARRTAPSLSEVRAQMAPYGMQVVGRAET
jgi:quercetin dioxygenase-like cupin family protein